MMKCALLGEYERQNVTVDVIQVWMTALAVHSFGTWTCFVADTNGGIEVCLYMRY